MDKHEAIAERKKLLARLPQTAEWKELRAVFDAKLEKHKNRIGSLILARETQMVVQREIDYLAGYWDAVNAILNTPERAEKTLDEALRKADLLKEANLVG